MNEKLSQLFDAYIGDYWSKNNGNSPKNEEVAEHFFNLALGEVRKFINDEIQERGGYDGIISASHANEMVLLGKLSGLIDNLTK